MPTTRKRIGHRMAFMITPQATYAWQRGDKHACHQALGVMPWDFSPLYVEDAEPPQWVKDRTGTDAVADSANWRRAWELRQALIELAGEPGPFDRHGAPLGVVLPVTERRR
jgi:hypothetical protein